MGNFKKELRLRSPFWPRGTVSAVASGEISRVVVGNLGLTNGEEDKLVAFLKTLTDGYKEPSVYPQKVP